jgi:hypothetical protein
MESTGRFNSELMALRSRSYDRCQSCGRDLPRSIAAYAGYASDGSARYVGQCCVEEIEELATHVYWWWEADKRVEPDTRLWRYMDLAKFLYLLEERTLFFARADRLGDPFEGASGIADREAEWDDFYLQHFRDAVRHPPAGHSPPSEAEVEKQARRLLASIRQIAERDRTTTFVSCWHANTGESEALWRLYCPPGSTGIAIETTAERLLQALDQTCRIKLGKVQYVDFRESFAGFHDRIFWKRRSLSHEAEVRAVCTGHLDPERGGLPMGVVIETLCVSVVPSPFAPPWFEALLGAIVQRYGFNISVTPSELLAQPFF